MIALTHVPSPNLQAGERSYIEHSAIDHALALQQHADYCRALQDLGWDVRTLSHHLELPDATFLEDTAVVLDKVAIVTSMGAVSRRAEAAAMEPVLRAWREVRRIELPALLEGGDVLRIGRRILVGRSQRTNAAGIEALSDIARPLGYDVTAVEVTGCLHLKTAVCALPDGRLLVNPAWVSLRDLAAFSLVPVPQHEPFAANMLLAGSAILLSDAHPETIQLLARDFPLSPVAISEFAKAEGGVTCLSLLIQ